MKDATREAVVFLGGISATAEAMGVVPSAVSAWLERGQVPATRAIQLEEALEKKAQEYKSMARVPVTRYELRPDLYPRP